MTTAESIHRVGDSPAARILWTIGKAAISLLLLAVFNSGLGYMREMRDDIKTATAELQKQHESGALLAQRVEGLQKVSDATVSTLTLMGSQVQDEKIDIRALQMSIGQQGRPKQ